MDRQSSLSTSVAECVPCYTGAPRCHEERRLATLLENDLFTRLPKGATAARTKLAVQQWQSARVLSTPQMCVTWPPSPGTARRVVQERSVFSVIVAGTTEQFSSIYFYFSTWGSGVGRNSSAAVPFIVHVLFGTDFCVFCFIFFNVVVVCSGQFLFNCPTYSERLGRVGTCHSMFFKPASHDFDTMKLSFRASLVFVSCGETGVFSLNSECVKLPPEKAFSSLTCRVL